MEASFGACLLSLVSFVSPLLLALVFFLLNAYSVSLFCDNKCNMQDSPGTDFLAYPSFIFLPLALTKVDSKEQTQTTPFS